MILPIRIIQLESPINQVVLEKYLGSPFTDMVKFVVDLKLQTMALGGELHADAEAILLEKGSFQEDLWGANIYPNRARTAWLEYTSLINIRPSQGNFSLLVQSELVRREIAALVNRLIL